MSEEPGEGVNWVRRLQIALAFLLPAAVGGLVGSVVLSFTLFADLVSQPETENEIFRVTHTGLAFVGTLMGATWGQLATLIVGLPAHIWLKHNTSQQVWMYVLAGMAAGTLFAITFVWPMAFGIAQAPLAMNIVWALLAGATAGAAAGLTFWLIRRPDRDARAAKGHTA